MLEISPSRRYPILDISSSRQYRHCSFWHTSWLLAMIHPQKSGRSSVSHLPVTTMTQTGGWNRPQHGMGTGNGSLHKQDRRSEMSSTMPAWKCSLVSGPQFIVRGAPDVQKQRLPAILSSYSRRQRWVQTAIFSMNVVSAQCLHSSVTLSPHWPDTTGSVILRSSDSDAALGGGKF
jgi:hypothetical protein